MPLLGRIFKQEHSVFQSLLSIGLITFFNRLSDGADTEMFNESCKESSVIVKVKTVLVTTSGKTELINTP